MGEKGTGEQSDYARYAATDWRVGRLYGKVLPAPLRKYLRQSVSPERRRQMRRWISQCAGVVGRGAEPLRRLPMRLRDRDSEVVSWRGRPALARIIPQLSPLVAKRRNVEEVHAALSAAGVPAFVVRNPSPLRFRLAVPASHRAAVADLLAGLAGTGGLYVQRIEHHGHVRLATPRVVRAAARDDYLLVTRVYADPTRTLVLGSGYGCEIEFWRVEGDRLVAPRANPCTDSVPLHAGTAMVSESVLSPFHDRYRDEPPSYPSRAEFAEPIYSDITFPIDVVYTWVDGADPAWQRRRADVAGEPYHPTAANAARFLSHDELRYSIRSVRMNMPWVRTIHLVTDGQVPAWLDTDGPGLRVVDHREIFSDPSVLPTFNSHAIESQLHHIDGLSEHFIYLNDDVCIGAPMVPEQFFLANGMSRFFPSPALVPLGDPGPDDIPSSVAGKNNRALIAKDLGAHLTHKMKHAPHALRRSVLAEIEDRFAEAHRRTAANRFRDMADISVASSLHHYYAFLTGRAVPGQISNAYFDLAAAETPGRLRQLLARRNRQVFCLNDTTTDVADPLPHRDMLVPFLEAYFPVRSSHEQDADVAE